MSTAELARICCRRSGREIRTPGAICIASMSPAIFRFCRRALPTREDAEDATTEIFMKVRQKLGMLTTRRRPFTTRGLYKVASNHIVGTCCGADEFVRIWRRKATWRLCRWNIPIPASWNNCKWITTANTFAPAWRNCPDRAAHGAGAALLLGDELRRNRGHAGSAARVRGSAIAARASSTARRTGGESGGGLHAALRLLPREDHARPL